MKKRIFALLTGLTMLFTAVPAFSYGATALDGAEKIGGLINEGDQIRHEIEDPSLLIPDSAKQKQYKPYAFESYFSLKDKLPNIRNQGTSNNCWAHGALASMESSLILAGTASNSIDLSENHLTWFTYNGKNSSSKSLYAGKDTFVTGDAYNDGGNNYFSAATLMRGYGAVSESAAPNAVALSSNLRIRCDYRLKNVDYLPDPKTKAGQNIIKQYLKTKGAVDISYYDSNEYYKEDQQYYCCTEKEIPNHEVTIAGWDDNAYVTGWSGSGAWIVRNSWGNAFADQGYFYISYDDKSLCDAAFFEAAKTKGEYAGVYQYDGTGTGEGEFETNGKTSSANRYTARKDERIKAVETYTPVANCKVEVSIYISPSASNPASGVKAASKIFTVPYAGYHTLELGTSIGVPKGYSFSVVICTSYKKGTKTYYYLANEVESCYQPIVSLDYSKGQSYIYNGFFWQDVTRMQEVDGYKFGNAVVKAYTVNTGTAAQAVSVKSSFTKTYGNKAFSLGAVRTKGSGRLYYKSSNTSVATVSTSGTVTIKGPGKATITVAAAPTGTYQSAAKTVSLTVKPKKSIISSVKSNSRKSLTVKWKRDSKASGYQAVIARNKSFSKYRKTAFIAKNSTTSKTFKNLSSRKTYYVKVRSYKTVSGKKLYGSYSSTKKITVR